MNLFWVIVILLFIGALGGIPFGGAPHGWYGASAGYFPSGIMGIILIVLVVMLLTGRL